MMMSSLSQSCAMAVSAIMHVSVMLEQQNPGTSHPGCWPKLYLRSSQDLGNTLHLAANKAPGAVVVPRTQFLSMIEQMNTWLKDGIGSQFS